MKERKGRNFFIVIRESENFFFVCVFSKRRDFFLIVFTLIENSTKDAFFFKKYKGTVRKAVLSLIPIQHFIKELNAPRSKVGYLKEKRERIYLYLNL